jgi:hypothetical protein
MSRFNNSQWTLNGSAGTYQIVRSTDPAAKAISRRVHPATLVNDLERWMSSHKMVVESLYRGLGGLPSSGLSLYKSQDESAQMKKLIREAFRSGSLVGIRDENCEIQLLDESDQPLLKENDKLGVLEQKKCVGERITLKLHCKNGGDSALRDIQWAIPDSVVANYQDNQERAELTALSKEDRKRSQVTFYWVGRQKVYNFAVEASCNCKGSKKTKKFSLKFDVRAPKKTYFKPVIGGIKLIEKPKKPKEYPSLTFSIRWEWTVQVPDLVDGELKDVQLVRIRRNRVWSQVRKGKAERKILSEQIPGNTESKDTYVLDTENPYFSSSYVAELESSGFFEEEEIKALMVNRPRNTVGFPQTVKAGGSFTEKLSSDDPGVAALEYPAEVNGKKVYDVSYEKVDFNDTFKYYVMYRPKTKDSIWVPVFAVDWDYYFKAERPPYQITPYYVAAEHWNLQSQGYKEKLKEREAPEFPQYTGKVVSFKKNAPPEEY